MASMGSTKFLEKSTRDAQRKKKGVLYWGIGALSAYIVALVRSDVTDVSIFTGRSIGRDRSVTVARFREHDSYVMPVAQKGFTLAIS